MSTSVSNPFVLVFPPSLMHLFGPGKLLKTPNCNLWVQGGKKGALGICSLYVTHLKIQFSIHFNPLSLEINNTPREGLSTQGMEWTLAASTVIFLCGGICKIRGIKDEGVRGGIEK